MKKAKALENISVRYFAVHLNRSHDPKNKRTPNGVLLFFACLRQGGWGLNSQSAIAIHERGSVGEEPKTIEYRFWRTKSPKQGARQARHALRRRATMRRDGAVFALAFRASPPAATDVSKADATAKIPDVVRLPVFISYFLAPVLSNNCD